MNPFHHFRRYRDEADGKPYNCTKCGTPSDSGASVQGCTGPREWETPNVPPVLTSGDIEEWLKDHPIKQVDKIRVFGQ